jgi:hypothetical protein
VLRPSALSYQIAVYHCSTIAMTCDDRLFDVCLFASSACIGAIDQGVGGWPKWLAFAAGEVPRKNFAKLIDSTQALSFYCQA